MVAADVKDIFFIQKVTDAVYEQFDRSLPGSEPQWYGLKNLLS